MAPGICLLSRGFVPGARAQWGRAQLCGRLIVRSVFVQLWSELPALAPGARCRLGRSIGSGAPQAMQWTAITPGTSEIRRECWSRGRIVSALLMSAAGGCHPSMEPPNPVATTMSQPVQASKRARQFDTARDLRQRVFMKGASWRGKNPRPEPGAGVLMRGPQPRDGLSRSTHQPSTCTVTLLTLWALGAVTVSRPSRYTA